jgi:hypothetical protein
VEELRASLHQTQELLEGYHPLPSESTVKAVDKAIKYGTTLSTATLDQAAVVEILKQGNEGYSTPPLCSSDTYLTTSI